MTALAECAERFADGEPALVGGDGGALVALAGATVGAQALGELYELGGDMVVLALENEIAQRLELSKPPRATLQRNGLSLVTPIDAADCVAGGWSLRDRAHTIRVAADPATGPLDLSVPGHVHPGCVDPLEDSGPAAAIELARAAGQPAAAALSAVLNSAGNPVSLREARTDSRLRALPIVPAGELRSIALGRELDRTAITCALPTRTGYFTAVAHASDGDGDVIVALIHGDPARSRRALVHTHGACLLGDTFRSLLCDCHARLEAAAEAIVAAGAGVILYSKPVVNDPFTCSGGRPIDPAVAAGLLRSTGIDAVILPEGDSAFGAKLTALGFELGAQPKART